MSGFFTGAGGALLGGGLGLAGGILSGNSTARAGRQQRNAQRTEDSNARSRLYGLYNLYAGGSHGAFNALPQSGQNTISGIDAQLANPNLGLSDWSTLSNRRNEILTRGLGANGPQTPGVAGYQSALDAERAAQLGEFDRTRCMADAYGPAARQSLASQYQPMLGLADSLNFDNWGSEAKAAADAAYNKAIKEGTNTISSALSSRGFGGSTLQQANEVQLRGEGAAGLAAAYAGIAGKQADLKLQAGQQRAGLMGDYANRMSAFDLNELARQRGSDADRFGLGQQFGNRRLGSIQDQNNAFLALQGGVGATQLSPSSFNGSTTGQNIGNSLGALGGNLMGGWLQQQYFPQNRGGGNWATGGGGNYLAGLYG